MGVELIGVNKLGLINWSQLIGVNYAFKIDSFKEFKQLANFTMILYLLRLIYNRNLPKSLKKRA